MTDLSLSIAKCLSLHAEAVDKLGTEFPERLPEVPPALRERVERQRQRVNATMTGVTLEEHTRHVDALNAGLRLLLKKMAPPDPPLSQTPKPSLPVWDDTAKAWRMPDAKGETRCRNS